MRNTVYMDYQNFREFLEVSALIWVNLFFLVGSLLSIAVWVFMARTGKKVNDTLDVVQGTAFSIYESFDRKGSQVIGTVGSFLGGLFRSRRRKR